MQIDIAKMLIALQKAPAYRLPDMNEGTGYLYNNFYSILSDEGDVMLSKLNYDAFDVEDIGTMAELHKNVFEQNYCEAHGISHTLQKIVPICRTPAYV